MTHDITLEKQLQTLLFQCEGGYYLMKRGGIDRDEFFNLIRKRGRLLQKVRGYGSVAIDTIIQILKGTPSHIQVHPEAERTISFLIEHRSFLPNPFQKLVPAASSQAFKSSIVWNSGEQGENARLVATSHEGRLAELRVPQVQSGMWMRPKTKDLSVFLQVFHDGEYEFELGNPETIVDAGAHIGLTSLLLSNRYPSAQILAIEPEDSNYALLERNTADYANIKTLKAGLWSHKTNLRIENPEADTWMFQVREVENKSGLPAFGVKDIIDMLDTEVIDVLKLDIEGAEREVFQSSTEWIDKVNMIIVETHDRYRTGCTEALEQAIAGKQFTRSKIGENIILRREKGLGRIPRDPSSGSG